MNPAPAILLPDLLNTTSLAAAALPLVSRPASTTVIIKGSWTIAPNGTLELLSPQIPLVPFDLHTGDPQTTACRYESDLVPFKPRADALCVGNAYTDRGKPAQNCVIAFGVGSWLKQIHVIGNRIWKASMGGRWNTPTPPEPFTTMRVAYENAFGGLDPADLEGRRFFAQNPIGKGYASDEMALGGRSIPNLEDPANRMTGPKDQPPPRCFGPIGRTWQPRLAYAGTYDKRWLAPDPPVQPDDFNEAYYNCAPADQQVSGYLRGDEKIRVMNMHPVHSDLSFHLPGLRVRCLADRDRDGRRQLEDVPTHLDTLWVDMEAMLLVLVWRARLVAGMERGVAHLLVISEPLGGAATPPEAHRQHVDVFEAAEAEAEEPELEHTEVAQGVPDLEVSSG